MVVKQRDYFSHPACSREGSPGNKNDKDKKISFHFLKVMMLLDAVTGHVSSWNGDLVRNTCKYHVVRKEN